MKYPKAAASALLLLGAALLGACGERGASDQNHTAVLGGFGRGAQQPVSALTPPAEAPQGATVLRTSPGTGLALWLRDGHVVAASYAAATGWAPAQPLEQIYGAASDPQLATDGNGNAMAIWRHTVGSIESLRYSRFDSSGWSVPDVMPGALPQPRNAPGAAPRLRMDAEGEATAEWVSGFDASQTQSARYVPGQGWSRAESVAAAATAAAPAPTTSR